MKPNRSNNETALLLLVLALLLSFLVYPRVKSNMQFIRERLSCSGSSSTSVMSGYDQ